MAEYLEVTAIAGADTGTAVANCRHFKGCSIFDATGDATIKVYRGTAATAANMIGHAAASDEGQFGQFSIGGDSVVPTPTGIFYVTTGASSESLIHYGL